MYRSIKSIVSDRSRPIIDICARRAKGDNAINRLYFRGVSRRTPGSLGFNVIFSSMVFPRVFLRKNYEKQVILTKKGVGLQHYTFPGYAPGQGRIQADAWKPGLQRDFFKYGISPGLSEKKL